MKTQTNLFFGLLLLMLLGCDKHLEEVKITEPLAKSSSGGGITFDNQTIHTPGGNGSDSYPRIVTLPNGDLLAAFKEDPDINAWGNCVIKFYKSTDDGDTWNFVSNLTDNRGLGLHDPQPFVMPVSMGQVNAGDLLCGVRSMEFVGANFIDVYWSDDDGVSWSFLSQIAAGNGWEENVYEPFFIIDDLGRLLCFYSDERSKISHSQKIVVKSSTNGGATWSVQSDVVRLSPQSYRPGMPQVAKMGNGKYILTYELVEYPNTAAVHYKISDNGYQWGDPTSLGTLISTPDGKILGGTPSVVWTPAGSANGTLIVTSLATFPASPRGSDNFISHDYENNAWTLLENPLPFDESVASQQAGYSRSVALSADGKTVYHITPVDFAQGRAKIMFAKTPVAYLADGTYKIRSNAAYWNLLNRTMEVAGMSTSDGAAIQQWDYFPNDGQKWEVTKISTDGYYKIINMHSGKALDVPFSSTTPDTALWQWTWNNTNAQKWLIEYMNDGQYRIVNKNGLAVTLRNGSTDNGTKITQDTKNNSTNQLWYFEKP